MDFTPDPALDRFRAEIRDAIRDALPPEMAARERARCGTASLPADSLAWTRILNARGWAVPHWPVEHGGTGWSPMQIHVFNDECASAWAPDSCWGATHMCGPVIYNFGSDALKERFLPAFRNGDFYVAQGFSEPGNGSDLARLRTAARRAGDHYVVRGQKIWTSSAWASKWGFFLVRTDLSVKPQAGISFLMIPMDAKGVTVRRIPEISGEADLCEVFLDDVEVPVGNLVGEEGMGWTYAKFLLDHERTSSAFLYYNRRELARARDIAARETLDGVPLAEVASFQVRLTRLEADITALEWSVLRELSHEDFRYGGTAAASTLKIAGSQIQQAVTELQADLLGSRATRAFAHDADDITDWPDYVPGRSASALVMRASTIYGGTLQIQRGIVAKLAFGL